jgi:ribosomal protein S18 acetylase RimI-like enzyme
MVYIIEGNEEHIPAIVQMAEKTWRATYSTILSTDQLDYMLKTIYGQEELTKVIQNGSQKFLLLKDSNGFQGFVSFGPRSENPDIFKIHKLYVLPANQGKGYGTILIEEVKKRLRPSGVTTLDLNVNRYNPAKEFYGKLGFEIVREEDVPIGPYWMNDYVMRLRI